MNLTAKSKVNIIASIEKVWEALTNPEKIKQYMFGTNVISDWNEGSPIIFKGEWNGKEYEDKGTILKYKPYEIIKYSHFSPLSGLTDKPENYHKVTIELKAKDGLTEVFLSQDNNLTESEREHSEKNWNMMLGNLKKLLEGDSDKG